MNFLEFKELRVKKGYTQDKMGILLGIDKMTITQFEKNGDIPTLALNVINAVLESEFINKEGKLKGFRKLKTGPIEPDLFNFKDKKKVGEKKDTRITKEISWYGAELKKYRKLMGFTHQSLGDLLGLDRRTIFNWENGSTIPKARFLFLDKLIAGWKIELSELDIFGKAKETQVTHELYCNEKPIEVVETNPTLESKYISLLEEQIKSLKTRLSKYE